ncbi:DUF4421 family protein [Nostoc ellipsosporum NOK]|nr:DUF4421 family protein [Nostoc ellipsosporum NOK]
MKLHTGILLLTSLFIAGSAAGQTFHIDSAYIKSFDKQNNVEFNGGTSRTRFQFSQLGMNKTGFRMLANTSAYAGVNLSYKWLSLRFSTAVPGTNLDRNTTLKYTSLSFTFGTRRWRYRPFYERYNGLLIPGDVPRTYEPFKNIRFTGFGSDFYWYANPKKYSLRAARSMSETQVKRAGSLFAIVTPMWQQINWQQPSPDFITDEDTYKLLASNPSWLSVTAQIGYGYNFIFGNGKWIISPIVAAGGGFLKETYKIRHKIQGISLAQGLISGGYNGKKYYGYLSGSWNIQQSRVLTRKMERLNTRVSLTAGFRFGDLKKKILGLL